MMPSDSTIDMLRKSVFGMFGIQKRLRPYVHRIYRTLFILKNSSQANLSFFYQVIKPAMYHVNLGTK